MARRKTILKRDDFTRMLRVWSAWGCVLGLVVYVVIYRIDSATRNALLASRVLSGVIFALVGIIVGRLLVTCFYDTDS